MVHVYSKELVEQAAKDYEKFRQRILKEEWTEEEKSMFMILIGDYGFFDDTKND
jgi:hypothetical protein